MTAVGDKAIYSNSFHPKINREGYQSRHLATEYGRCYLIGVTGKTTADAYW